MMATRIMQDINRQVAKAKAKAKGKNEAEAQGRIAMIHHLVAKGRLSVDAARAEIEELMATKSIPRALGREALKLLG